MDFGILHISAIVAIIQSVILVLILLNKKNEMIQANTFLAGLLFTFVILLSCSILLSTILFWRYYRLAYILSQSAFLIGPLIYLYTKSIFNKNFIFKNQWLHFVPFILGVIYLILKFYFVHLTISCRSNELLLGGLTFTQNFIYFIFTFLLFKKHGCSLNLFNKDKQNPYFTWPKYIFYGTISIWILKLLFFLTWDVLGYKINAIYILAIYFFVYFLFLNFMIYTVIDKPNLFKVRMKYQKSILHNKDIESYKQKLLNYMNQKRPYLDFDMSLNILAENLHIPPKHLSQIVNESFNQNFYDFINNYRLDESLRRLKNKKYAEDTILMISLDSGFKSKSTFNALLKKKLGITPKQYRNNY